MATAVREGMCMVKLSRPLALAVTAVVFVRYTASASVAPDPSDSTVLVADVAEGVTETYADKIAPSYAKFVKTGKGTLILTAKSSESSSTDFMGSVEVREGVLQLNEFYAIQACSYNSDTTKYKVSVSSNAQIRVTFNSSGQTANALYNVAIEGDGPDGRGAFVFDGGGNGDSLIRVLHLTGDASIGGTGRFGVGYYGKLYLNGHTLTGTNNEYMFRCVQVMDGKEGHFVKRGGTVTLQNADTTVYLHGSAANTFTLSNATMTIWSAPALDSPWTLRSIDSSSFKAHGAINQWRGPIVGDGKDFTVIGDTVGAVCNFYGTITNFSSFATSKWNENFTLNLVNANHYFNNLVHYHGDMVVTGGAQHVFGSLLVNHADSTKAASLTFVGAGEVVVTNGASMNRVYTGNGAPIPARMAISGRTNFRGESGTTFMVGDDSTASWATEYPNYWGSLAVTDGATMTNDMLQVGYRGAGALYQRDSDVYAGQKLYLGYGYGNKNSVLAYGYWGAANSQLTLAGGFEMAYAANSAAFFVQRGGRTDITDSSATYFSRQGHAGVYVGNGGVLNNLNGNLFFGGSGDGGSASVTVDGEGSLIDLTGRSVSWMCHKNFKTFVNLNNGGTLRAYRFQYESYRGNLETSRTYLSFDGGVLDVAPTGENADYKVFMEWTSGSGPVYSYPDVCTVFGGGAVLGVTRADAQVHWTSPLLKPSGKSVTAIALPTDADFGTTTHLGALRVVIEGDGEGASAFVDFDDATGTPSKIVVTSPGINYVEGTTAKVIEMRANKEWSCAVTLGELTGGGLVKTGPGTLILKGEATYEGATTVRDGTLILGTFPFPQGQPMVLAGGKFNAAARDVMVSDVSGYGTYSSDNGRRVTITNKLSFAVADAMAGRQLTFEHVEPVFNAGATIEVDATGLPDGGENLRFVLATSDKAFAGEQPLFDAPKGWRLRFSSDRKSIILGRERGLQFILR
ncbi:MAG: autotransporter-associated beta strand repeat-containing protein [Kiritimatiellae bacterium]|nr:autotransporter-associated beta strand repeat-containing protein [Kiritimatiellia bacterium]